MRERIIRAVAGIFILTSLLLAYFVHFNYLLIAAFVGLNLLQSSITKWCMLDDILRKGFKIKS
jgi:hypothetical protein